MSSLTVLNLEQIKIKVLRKMLQDDGLLPSITPTTSGRVIVSMTVILSDEDFKEEVQS